MFFGTNDKYYEAVQKIIHNYPNHGILTYDAKYVNINNNNIFVPVENMLGLFDTARMHYLFNASFEPSYMIVINAILNKTTVDYVISNLRYM